MLDSFLKGHRPAPEKVSKSAEALLRQGPAELYRVTVLRGGDAPEQVHVLAPGEYVAFCEQLDESDARAYTATKAWAEAEE